MDALELCEFVTVEFRIKRDRKTFLKVNNISSYDKVRYLLWINYFMQKRGHCYDAVLAYFKQTDGGNLPMTNVRRMLYYLYREGFVAYARSEKLHPVLKRRYLLTDKAHSVIDNYLALFSKEDKNMTYMIKKVHIDADKLAEKD